MYNYNSANKFNNSSANRSSDNGYNKTQSSGKSYAPKQSNSAPVNPRSTKNNNKPWSPKAATSSKPTTSYKPQKKNFMDKMEEVQKGYYSDYKLTENGAIGYATSGSALVDMNYKIASYRNKTEDEITADYRKAFSENPELAIRFLGYVLDIREGQGERRLSKTILRDLMRNGGAYIVAKIIPLLGEYGRYDMLYNYIDYPITRKAVVKVITSQWKSDVKNMNAEKPISLMAKWLKSANSHNEETRKLGLETAKMLGLSETQYRKTLSMLRNYLDVTEVKMSAQKWSEIDYEAVPSKANLIYKNAFMRHDAERRIAFMAGLASGEAKINSSVNYPHEIVHSYKKNCTGYWDNASYKKDETLEALWKALPNLVTDEGSTVVVADGSGSMCCTVDRNNSTTAWEVATALAIYFSERAMGEYRNKYITFSSKPKFVRFTEDMSLNEKLGLAMKYNECANTNIEATFDLILDTAIKTRATQDEIPANVLIISDGEFDAMTCTYTRDYTATKAGKPLFDNIAKKFRNAGYKMPKLIFWNVASRNCAIPMRETDGGVILVSGFSVNTMKLVMQNETDPKKALYNILMSDRYDSFATALKPDVRKNNVRKSNAYKNNTHKRMR